MTFRACSSPAQTPVKPQPDLQYLAKSQSTQRFQSLITTGSDHPPVLKPHMVLNLPLDVCIDNAQDLVTKEKRKRKEINKKTSTSDRKPKKGKEQDHLKKTSLGPLRQGQRLDTSETKSCSSKERKSPNQSSNTTKSSPCTYASSPEPMHTPLNQCSNATRECNKEQKTCSLCPGQLDRHHQAVRLPTTHLTT
jgi:hypothetical protein